VFIKIGKDMSPSLKTDLSNQIVALPIYRMRGTFGSDFNLAVWQILQKPPN